MTEWLNEIDIKIPFQQAKNNEISLNELAKIILKKLSKLNVEEDFQLTCIKEDFESLAYDNEEVDAKDFDFFLNQLYDWADQIVEYNPKSPTHHRKMCWIKTF
ncbi:MAG: hypothetical protein ABEK17_00020 [Candidatus Aenigmatarchaeota archaeon]